MNLISDIEPTQESLEGGAGKNSTCSIEILFSSGAAEDTQVVLAFLPPCWCQHGPSRHGWVPIPVSRSVNSTMSSKTTVTVSTGEAAESTYVANSMRTIDRCVRASWVSMATVARRTNKVLRIKAVPYTVRSAVPMTNSVDSCSEISRLHSVNAMISENMRVGLHQSRVETYPAGVVTCHSLLVLCGFCGYCWRLYNTLGIALSSVDHNRRNSIIRTMVSDRTVVV